MTTDDSEDSRMALALARYEAISPYIALEPGRGQKRKLLEQLAAKTLPGPDGEPLGVTAETLRSWVRRYRRGGLAALMDKPRPKRGVGVLSHEQCELICNLKREVPERSVDRIITIAVDMELVGAGVLKRSTVHRILHSRGLSARKARVPDAKDLDRFEAAAPNDLWQSDLLQGPWLPDPARPGKTRRADLFAFVDDHSRLLLHGRFSFRENLPALELVFRRAVQRWGRPVGVYYDNAQVYRSIHMRQIVAALGCRRMLFTRKHRPQGHGKIEKLNGLIKSAFIAEVKASSIRTLDELNEAFRAWSDLHYNRKVHGETGEAPVERWRAGAERVRYADEQQLRQAFLWKENRTPDKTGVFWLLGIRYQVSSKLARRRVQVRFDPEVLHEVEVWRDGTFVERAHPLQVNPWRRPKQADETVVPAEPTADWLGHLVRAGREQSLCEPRPESFAHRARSRRAQADQAVLDLLADRLEPAAFDEAAARKLLSRFGPFDPARAASTLDALLQDGAPADQHVTFYLDAIRADQRGGLS